MKKGLTSSEAEIRLAQYGLNVIEEKKRASRVLQFLSQFKDLMVIILIVASVFAYFAGEQVDGSIILGIVIINAAIGFLQEFKAERAVEALKKMLSPKARVMRDSTEQMIEAKLLVPGDLVILHEGDKVSADCELFEDNEIYTDESVLTGESVPVKKDTGKNKKLCMGTQVSRGNGRAIVIATGMNTEFGKIATLTSETKKDKSPLQKELAHLGAFVGKVTIGISVILFLIGVFIQGRAIIDTLLFAVAVAVAAVPEGLPATITVALALGIQRMAKKNAIVKQLSSVETLGSTTVICTDKTGTLTKNQMTVQEMTIGEYTVIVRGGGYEPEGSLSFHHDSSKDPEYFEYQKNDLASLMNKKPALYGGIELVSRACVLCNNARLLSANDQWKILGDPTEGALIVAAEKAGFPYATVTNKYKKIFEIPFDSNRKRMSVIAEDHYTKTVAAYVKGAPDSLIKLCTHKFQDGQIVPLREGEKEAILKRSEQMAGRALRTIALAYKELSKKIQHRYDQDEIEKDLIFLGLVGMADPPREEVKEAVKLTHKAGIRVFIITGDHGLTAHAIAKEIGLLKSSGVSIITGEMLDKMLDSKLIKHLEPSRETIFARVSPEHKLRIVDILKKSGEVVAVTGDGVNDAPALKRADIGVAMGITGTDVSKEAANMVLADDSFATIIAAVAEGRTIYENMKKFIYFIFSSNIGEVVAVFAGIAMGLPAPLTAVFLLIINTLTDVFPSLALGIEPAEENILAKSPRKPDSKIMEWRFIRRYLINGIYKGFLTIGVFIGNLMLNGWTFGQALEMDSQLYIQSSTMAFVALTFIQMVQAINSRSLTVSIFKMNFFGNMYLLASIAFTVISTVLVVQLPFFARFLKTSPLTLNAWGVLILLSLSIIILEETRKLFYKRQSVKTIQHAV